MRKHAACIVGILAQKILAGTHRKAMLGFKVELYIISFAEPWGDHSKAQWSILNSEQRKGRDH